MPAIIQGKNRGSQNMSEVHSKDYQYDYGDLDLKPGSELHDVTVTRLMEYVYESASIMQTRHGSWNNIDQLLTGYKLADDEEYEVVSNDPRKPVSIVFPYSYAIMETLLSYMMTAFFQDPMFRYEGYSPEDVMGSILLEKVVNLHCVKHKVMLNIHTMFRDCFAYGIGPAAPIWKSNKNFSGNALVNIDPYRYLPDPNVSATGIQDGLFVGWVQTTNYLDLLTEEGMKDSDLFNVKYLKHLQHGKSSVFGLDDSDRNSMTGAAKSHHDDILGVDIIPLYVKIIPSDWNLGSSDRPEKWFFQVAGDSLLISARKAGFDHDKFPAVVAAPDYDGYSATPLGRLEILSGLQGVLDWLFNSHIANVRKALNDMLIYDPYLVNSKDLEDPKPGKLIRMRRPAWGQGKIKESIHQLAIHDVTQQNIADSNWIVQWMQKIGATDDAAMGSLRQGGPERLTAQEFKGTAGGAISRLERIAKIVGLQAMQEIGEFFGAHTQEMITDAMYVKVHGDWVDVLLDEYGPSISRGRMKVSPRDLNVMYDVIVRDGSVPGSNFSDVWIRMFDVLSQHPELSQKFDIVQIFKHIARNSGVKNVNDFIRRGGGQVNAQVMPDEQVQQQAAAGNLVPMGGGQ